MVVVLVLEGIDKITAQQQLEGESPTINIWHLLMQQALAGSGHPKEGVALQPLHSLPLIPTIACKVCNANALTKVQGVELPTNQTCCMLAQLLADIYYWMLAGSVQWTPKR